MWGIHRFIGLVRGYKGYMKHLSTLLTMEPTESGPAPVNRSTSDEKFTQQSCRIAILGALTTTGQILALFLKQNPLISHIFLYDYENPSGLASDLIHLDTHTCVTAYHGENLHWAVQNVDIIIVLGMEAIKPDTNIEHKLNVEGKRLINLATVSALHAPKAILVDCVHPLSATLPMISDIYRRNNWYHPGKIIGSVAQQQMQTNTFFAKHIGSDPSLMHVPLLGGPEEDLLLPLFSRASPCSVQVSETIGMINLFRRLECNALPTAKSALKHEYAPYGNAFAINRLVSTIGLGLLGDSSAIGTAFVRTNFIQSCKHMVSTVKFGRQGICHNYGIPKLTRFELSLLEKITMEIQAREYMAWEYLQEHRALLTKTETESAEFLYFPATVEYSPPEDTIAEDCY